MNEFYAAMYGIKSGVSQANEAYQQRSIMGKGTFDAQ
jgi:hypothetical protein